MLARVQAGEWRWLTPSVAVLGLANLIPLFGVMWLGWEVFPIILLYWLENVIVGGFNVLRMLSVRPRDIARWLGKLFLIPFFVVHYGMFTAIHGVFVFSLFGEGMSGNGFFPNVGTVWSALVDHRIVYVALALLLSHGFSFVWNYLGKGENQETTLERLMSQPYRRVIVLHFVMILGGFAVLALGEPTAALFMLVLLKIGVDAAAHVKEHGRYRMARSG
jgi:hypothetical protein